MENEKTLSSRLIILSVTGLGLGYSPIMPGTFGTLLGIPVAWIFSMLPYWTGMLSLITFFFVACWLSEKAEKIFGEHDSPHIVIDEITGYALTMLSVPFNLKTAVWAFIFFRIFDILKPYPVRRIDIHLKNGYGVVLDDAISGLYANFVLRLFLALHILPGVYLFD